jgi:hypothetical protein
MYPQCLRKTKHKSSRWRVIINIRMEITEMETKITIQSNNEIKSWFFEKIKAGQQ